MSIGLCCISMPALSKMLGHHLPPYKKFISWLLSPHNSSNFTFPNSSLSKSPRQKRDLLSNKRETPRTRDSYLDLEGNNAERLDPDASLSPYERDSMKDVVRTFIGSGKHNVIDDDGIHFEVELQQHSRQYDSR